MPNSPKHFIKRTRKEIIEICQLRKENELGCKGCVYCGKDECPYSIKDTKPKDSRINLAPFRGYSSQFHDVHETPLK